MPRCASCCSVFSIINSHAKHNRIQIYYLKSKCAFCMTPDCSESIKKVFFGWMHWRRQFMHFGFGLSGENRERVARPELGAFIMHSDKQFIFIQLSFSNNVQLNLKGNPRNNKLYLIQYRKLLMLLFFLPSR